MQKLLTMLLNKRKNERTLFIKKQRKNTNEKVEG